MIRLIFEGIYVHVEALIVECIYVAVEALLGFTPHMLPVRQAVYQH